MQIQMIDDTELRWLRDGAGMSPAWTERLPIHFRWLAAAA
jgi:hypothetical protein